MYESQRHVYEFVRHVYEFCTSSARVCTTCVRVCGRTVATWWRHGGDVSPPKHVFGSAAPLEHVFGRMPPPEHVFGLGRAANTGARRLVLVVAARRRVRPGDR